MSALPAASSVATPVTTRAASPSSVAPRAAARAPRVNCGCAIRELRLLGRRLLVVCADDVLGHVGGRRHVRDELPLDDHEEPALGRDLLDDAVDLTQHLPLQVARLLL